MWHWASQVQVRCTLGWSSFPSIMTSVNDLQRNGALIATPDSVAFDWPSSAITDDGPQGITTTTRPVISSWCSQCHADSLHRPYSQNDFCCVFCTFFALGVVSRSYQITYPVMIIHYESDTTLLVYPCKIRKCRNRPRLLRVSSTCRWRVVIVIVSSCLWG